MKHLLPKERNSNNPNTQAREGMGKVAHKHASQTLSLKETKPRIGNPQLYRPCSTFHILALGTAVRFMIRKRTKRIQFLAQVAAWPNKETLNSSLPLTSFMP
jgi:hypothetical protein